MSLSGTFLCFIYPSGVYKQEIWNNEAYFHFWALWWCKGMSVFMWNRFVFLTLQITHIFAEKLILFTGMNASSFSDVSTAAALYGWNWGQLTSFTSESSLVQKIFSVRFLWGFCGPRVYVCYGRNWQLITYDLKWMRFWWSWMDTLSARSNSFFSWSLIFSLLLFSLF